MIGLLNPSYRRPTLLIEYLVSYNGSTSGLSQLLVD